MRFSSAVHGAVYAGIALQLLLVGVLLTKRCWRKLPFFTIYSLATLVGTGFGWAVHYNTRLYYYTYWINEVFGVILGFAVVYEVFHQLLSPHPALHKLANLVFKTAAVVLAVVGASVFYVQSGAHNLIDGVFVTEQAVRVIEIGLLMFLFLFASVFGLHWRRHEFGIALGLGIFVSVELVNLTMSTHLGPVAAQTFGVIRGITFDLSMLIWMGYILVPERVVARAELPQRAQLEQWNRAMMELINQ